MPRTSAASGEEIESLHEPPPPPFSISVPDGGNSSSSLAAKAIRASSAHRDFSLSSAYGESAVSSPRESNTVRSSSFPSSTNKVHFLELHLFIAFQSYAYTFVISHVHS